jgi:DNA-binding protein H-NS
MNSLQQLERSIAKLQAKADAERRRLSTKVIANIQHLMAQYHLTPADIARAMRTRKKLGKPAGAAGPKPHTAAGKLPPKYRDPKTGATWSGHARPPTWIKNAQDRSKFLINEQVTAAASAKAPAHPKPSTVKPATNPARPKTATRAPSRTSAASKPATRAKPKGARRAKAPQAKALSAGVKKPMKAKSGGEQEPRRRRRRYEVRDPKRGLPHASGKPRHLRPRFSSHLRHPPPRNGTHQ